MNDATSYYPHFGHLLPDGRLRIPTAGQADDGEKWDGFIEISREDPRYDEWLLAIQGKDEYQKELKQQNDDGRELRRASRKHQG